MIITTYSNEHDPAHVHVITADWEIKVNIEKTLARFDSVKWGTVKGKEKKRAVALVEKKLEQCWNEWNRQQ